MMKKTQRTLTGGSVEDYEKGLKQFEALFSLFSQPKPIIGFTGWEDSITEEQKQRIIIERFKQLKEANGNAISEATDYEAMVYLMTSSFNSPMSRQALNIYAHLFRKFYPDKVQDVFGDGTAGKELDKWIETPELIRLKQWLWKVQTRHQKEAST